MIWNVEVKAGDVIELTFVVKVEDITKTTITNVATIDGEEIPDKPTTKVAHITTTKTSTPSKTPLHELDTITYTLAATNDGTGAGSVKIADTIPVGTSLVGDIKIGDKTYTVDDLNKGIEVELNAGESKSIVFTVQVNPFKSGDENVVEKDGSTIRTIRNAEATQDGKEVPPTEDTVEKEYVSITATKAWNDADNAEKLRKDVTFRLYANGKDAGKTATASEKTNWAANFGDKFDKYDADKNEIEYTIKEDTTLNGYKQNSEVVGNNGTIINELDFSQFTKQITVTKIWEDNNNSKLNEKDTKGPRPDSIGIIFKGSDKSEISETLTASPVAKDSESIWSKTYTLPKYDSNGNEITYTVDEEPIDYYVQTSKVISDDKSNVTITNAIPNLKIEKTVSTINGKLAKGDTVKEGDIVGYDITVTNIGTIKLEKITVKDVMANKGAIFREYDDETSIIEDGIISDDLTLDVKNSETYTVYYKVTADDVKDASKKINNTATAKVTYKDENKTDRTIEREATVSINPTANADISIKKEQKIGDVSVDKDGKTSDGTQIKVEPNTKITYTITVVNKGNTVQENVVVTDEMTRKSSQNYTIKSVKVNGSDRKYTQTDSNISIGALGIGQTAVITIEYTVSEDDMSENEGTIENKVSVNKKDKDGNTPTDEVEVPTKEWKADIDVVKSSTLYRDGKEISGPAMYGDIIKYTIKATNTGNKEGTVKIYDTVPSGTNLIRTAGTTNLSKVELDALESKAGLTKGLEVEGKKGTTNGTASIYFEVKVVAKAGTNIKNTATIDDKEEKSDKGYDVINEVFINAKTTSMAEKNITIVLDLSSSMAKGTAERRTRLDDAKSAINSFVKNIYSKQENSNVKINIVTFNYKDAKEAGRYYQEAYKDIIGTHVYSKITKSNYTSELSKINNIQLPYGYWNGVYSQENGGLGTNISAGLNKASELTSGKKENNIVILLGDGDPTEGIDSKDNAEAVATELKKKATLYTIAFGKGTDSADSNFMKRIATDENHAFTSDDADKLSENFDAIYNDEKDQYNDEKILSDKGKVKLLIPTGMQLDIEKGIVIEVNGVKKSAITSIPSDVISTDEDGNIIWDISGYDANATLRIYYYLK